MVTTNMTQRRTTPPREDYRSVRYLEAINRGNVLIFIRETGGINDQEGFPGIMSNAFVKLNTRLISLTIRGIAFIIERARCQYVIVGTWTDDPRERRRVIWF